MALVCMLSILLFHVITASRQRHLKEGETHIPSRYVWDKLYFGTQWKIYIQVMEYDLLSSSFSSNNSPFKTLLDVTRNLPTIATKNHPCRKGIFVVYGLEFEGKAFVQETTVSNYFFDAALRICGELNVTFIPGHVIDEPNIV